MAQKTGNKVVVIGTGAVGVSYAYAVLNQGICDELVLIDLNVKRAFAEACDLSHGVFNGPTPVKVKQGTYEDCADADIICICAGVPQKPGETRLQLIDNNLSVFNSVVGEVMKTGFDGIFLLASNPVDVLSYATFKFSGLPKHRVIGSGTVLDTARLCYFLSEEFNVAPQSIDAYMIGEHGDSVLAAWSSAYVAGTSVKEYFDVMPNGKERMEQIRHDVMRAAYSIIEGKGATYYGIGMGLARITKAILFNQNCVLPVSALLEGEYGENDVYTGVPAVINRNGIARIIEKPLDADEKQKFADSANILRSYQEKVHAYLNK
ncbi:L-lactate dehydrogenase [Kingella negevensis]|uniref:L-lactate dehydrogenase n=1 Tax=Kingella negevensis TaxID=1522312 RepID=A0A238HHV6_9NEIS|nr:L-lactate dehydrogenase [Kingella negevensis]MDK4685505.1 L-lactate dehydrogenase [Kingella negevensis]MDK4697191.1 L-lactate dehydrogenase [Kingella negevensis]MDK4708690.1 L-lactate dehydrogenase [Kingella negevensis]MDK4709214.1 L-lactate dehydrogenase [Kingella negevensis]SNB79748.1 L-lactate dehydrogenase 1 [Kingella negevensis]